MKLSRGEAERLLLLSKVDEGGGDTRSICARLGLSCSISDLVEEALNTLEREGLLRREEGAWRLSEAGGARLSCCREV